MSGRTKLYFSSTREYLLSILYSINFQYGILKLPSFPLSTEHYSRSFHRSWRLDLKFINTHPLCWTVDFTGTVLYEVTTAHETTWGLILWRLHFNCELDLSSSFFRANLQNFCELIRGIKAYRLSGVTFHAELQMLLLHRHYGHNSNTQQAKALVLLMFPGHTVSYGA